MTLVLIGDLVGQIRVRFLSWQRRDNELNRIMTECTFTTVFLPFLSSEITSLIVCGQGWTVFGGHDCIRKN